MAPAWQATQAKAQAIVDLRAEAPTHQIDQLLKKKVDKRKR
jgi:DNA uptake protein ComE-like DNA-binding protein